ncbi:helix-turn-helix domain-containing protein [Nocardiopsis sp. CNT-189]|uniref:helix-turn-helix domain-containing protein n=1 Tax=Nocardiopsis oceanisediminis TaxID=2816862 RepID=UPI003B35E6F7
MPTPPESSLLIPPKEAAEALGISRITLRWWREEGRVLAFRARNGHWYYALSSVEDLVRNGANRKRPRGPGHPDSTYAALRGKGLTPLEIADELNVSLGVARERVRMIEEPEHYRARSAPYVELYRQGMDPRSIARRLAVTPSTARARLREARKIGALPTAGPPPDMSA